MSDEPESQRGRWDILNAVEIAKIELLAASKAHTQQIKLLFKQELERIRQELTALTKAVESDDRPRITWNVISVKDLDTGLVTQGVITKMNLTDSQKTRVTFGKPVTKKGNPATIDGEPGFEASDDAITLTPVEGDAFSIDVSANHPNVDVAGGVLKIFADADLGEGVERIEGVEAYVVIAGKAAGFGPSTVGEITEQ